MTTAHRLTQAVAGVWSAVKERDQLIRTMRDEGATLREIAAAAELTPMGVKKILDRSDPRGEVTMKTDKRWMVIDYRKRGSNDKPRMLHHEGCWHAEYRTPTGWVRDPMRPPVGDEQNLPKCSTCLNEG